MSVHPVLRVGIVALTLAAACGGEEPPPGTEASTPAATPSAQQTASVSILAPAEGDTISGDSVTVRLAATGVEIVPAGDTTSGTGHHHLYLDQDLGQPGQAVPTVPGHVVHLGTGASEYTFTDVPVGPHRLIAVVADGLHVPLQPWVTDTVRFVVR